MVKKILPTDNDTANGVRKNNSQRRKSSKNMAQNFSTKTGSVNRDFRVTNYG